MQFAVGGGRDVLEGSEIGGARSGFANHVEFTQCLLAIDVYIENAAGLTAAGHVVLTVESLGKVQPQFIDAWWQRDIVSKITLPPALVDARLASAQNRVIQRLKNVSTLKIPVRQPDPAETVGVIAAQVAGQNSNVAGAVQPRRYAPNRRAGSLR